MYNIDIGVNDEDTFLMNGVIYIYICYTGRFLYHMQAVTHQTWQRKKQKFLPQLKKRN